MKCHLVLLPCLLGCLSWGLVAGDSSPRVVGVGQPWGYGGGDGSSILEAQPPRGGDLGAASRIAWKAPLSAPGLGQPIVVEGRVVVTLEPERGLPWPRLACFDLATGAERWRAVLNHLPASGLTQAQQAELDRIWTQYYDDYFLIREIRGLKPEDPRRATLIAQAVSRGMAGDFDKPGTKAWVGKTVRQSPAWQAATGKSGPYAKAALCQDTYTFAEGNYGSHCLGEAFATPVSDGRRVYSVTAPGAVFCHDLDGKLLWLRHLPHDHGGEIIGRSPIRWRDLVLCDNGNLLRVLAADTGEPRWTRDLGKAGTFVTPRVLRCGGEDIVLCANRRAFLLPDGRPLAWQGPGDTGTSILIKHDEPDVAFFGGGGEHGASPDKGKDEIAFPWAGRFRREGDALRVTQLWDGTILGKAAGNDGSDSCKVGHVYHAGRLYFANVALDAASGKPLLTSSGKGHCVIPPAGHLRYLADGLLVGLRETWVRKGDPRSLTMSVFDLAGKEVASGKVPGSSYSSSFTLAGPYAIIRTADALYALR
jgi:outer membrane protein assembly factor BamB